MPFAQQADVFGGLLSFGGTFLRRYVIFIKVTKMPPFEKGEMLGLVTEACYPSTREAELKQLPLVRGQPGIHTE